MKKIFKPIKKKNAKELQKELGRAHLIVALLAIAISALLSLGATETIEFNPILSAVCVALLSFVTIVSLGTSISLLQKKK